MLDVGGTVTVLRSPGQDPEAFSSDSVYDWSTVRKKMDTPDDQHAAVIHEPAVADKRVSVWAPLHSGFFPQFISVSGRLRFPKRTLCEDH